MLDLKAKLASAGLVTAEDIERIDKSKGKGKGKQADHRKPAAGLNVAALRDKPKAEIYDAVRRWVDKVRLDSAGATPSEAAQAFHFAEASGKVGRLYLEAHVVETLRKGQAGVIAYMSNHGLAHAVVSAEGARAIAEVNPLWLRMLEGDERAGRIEK